MLDSLDDDKATLLGRRGEPLATLASFSAAGRASPRRSAPATVAPPPPFWVSSGPQTIWTSVQILNVGNIRVGDQSFDTRFNLECRWDVYDPSELARAQKVRADLAEGGGGSTALAWDPGLAFPSAICYEVYGTRAVIAETADAADAADDAATDAVASATECSRRRETFPTNAPASRPDSSGSGGGSGSTGETAPSRGRRVGRVGFRWRIGGTFKCSQNLRDFPFDKQALRVVVQLGFEASSGRQIFTREATMRQDPRKPNVLFHQSDSEYTFRPVRFLEATTGPLESATPISRFVFTLPIERDPQNHFYTMFVILAIASMALSAFILPRSATSDRLGIPLNLLLVLVAFKYSISSSLPSVPYLTFLDKYIFVCFGFLFAAFAFAGVIALRETISDDGGDDGDGSGGSSNDGADRLAVCVLVSGMALANGQFYRMSTASVRLGSARIGRMGKIDEAMVRLLSANGIGLTEHGTLDDLPRYHHLQHWTKNHD